MSSSCTVIVTLTPLPGQTQAVVDTVVAELEHIRQAPGCELYDLFTSVSDTVVLIERWSTRELWQAHFDTPPIVRLKQRLTPLLAQPAHREEMYLVS